MYATKIWSFPFWYFLEYRSKWINVYIRLKAFFEILQLFFHVVYPFGFFMIVQIPYFAPKSFSLPFIPLLDCPRNFSYFLIEIFFRCFGRSCFVYIIWPCFGIFLVFLLSPVPFGLSFRVVSFVVVVLLFPLFLIFSSVLSPLLVVVDFLSVFLI